MSGISQATLPDNGGSGSPFLTMGFHLSLSDKITESVQIVCAAKNA